MNNCLYSNYRQTLTDFNCDINASNCKSISLLFNYSSIKNFNITINVPNCTDFSKTFYSTSDRKLSFIKNIITTNGENFSQMFYDCRYLSAVPYLELSAGTNFDKMFYNCYSLSGLQTEMFNTLISKTDANKTDCFTGCSSLFLNNYDQWKQLKDNGWTTDSEEELALLRPLTFTAVSANTIVTLTNDNYFDSDSDSDLVSLSTSIDNGHTWQTYSINNSITLTNIGDTVMFKGSTKTFSTEDNFYIFTINEDGQADIKGNCNSLINFNNELYEKIFIGLFSNCNVRNAKDLILPATNLANYCYYRMFNSCTNLISIPNLPATSLASNCYCDMFQHCNHLNNITTLPASTLANNCYQGMFDGCTSLTNTPELPVIELAEGCYYAMFRECTNLNNTPALPATSLISSNNIFGGCYREMFKDCKKINSISTYFTSWNNNATLFWLSGVSDTGTFYNLGNAPITTRDESHIPSGWNIVNPYAPVTESTPLTFTAVNANTIVTLSACYNPDPVLLSTSIDNGTTWNSYTVNNSITLANIGDTVMFKGSTETFSSSGHYKFIINNNGLADIKGNCNSLINFSNNLKNLIFNWLFTGCNIRNAKDLLLPATNLADYCYQFMFQECTSLSSAPVLPATDLAKFCYNSMFKGCTSLSSAPVLPATNLADYCYYNMFAGCTSLSSAPVLPATDLAKFCYNSMFKGCTSLSSAPVLPATDLAKFCYNSMFKGCTSLNSVSAYFTDWNDENSATNEWLYNVSNTGTFYNLGNAPEDQRDKSHIPAGWNIEH